MIFNESYDLLQENGDEKKKPSGIVIAAEIIATIIIIIVTVILLVPTMIVVGIIGSVGGGLTNKEKAILKELNKHPKAKQLIVKAAKKMQDLLKKNIKSDLLTAQCICGAQAQTFLDRLKKPTKDKAVVTVTQDAAPRSISRLS